MLKNLMPASSCRIWRNCPLLTMPVRSLVIVTTPLANPLI